MGNVKLTVKELDGKSMLLKGISTPANDKLNYAIKKLTKNIETVMAPLKTKYNDELDDKRIEFASTYPDTHPDVEKRGTLITKPDGNFTFTPENNKKFNKDTAEITKKFLEQVVEIETYFTGVGPGWERLSEIDMFTADELKGLLFEYVEDGVIVDGKKEDAKIKKIN